MNQNSILYLAMEELVKHFYGTLSYHILEHTKKIVLTVASSEVASLLLPNGRTTHSRFRIPIQLDELSTCDIKRGTKLAKLLIETNLIIWDEALMTNKQCFEAFDRSIKDIMAEFNEKMVRYRSVEKSLY